MFLSGIIIITIKNSNKLHAYLNVNICPDGVGGSVSKCESQNFALYLNFLLTRVFYEYLKK